MSSFAGYFSYNEKIRREKHAQCQLSSLQKDSDLLKKLDKAFLEFVGNDPQELVSKAFDSCKQMLAVDVLPAPLVQIIEARYLPLEGEDFRKFGKEPRILIIGSINMDISCDCERIPDVGETVLGGNFRNHPGGKGANQAAAVARLGGHCTFLGRVGSDEYAEPLHQRMKGEGIHCDSTLLRCTDGVRTGIAMIFVDSAGSNSIVVASGANFELSAEDVRNHEHLIEETDLLLLQLESPLPTVYEAIRLAKKHKKKVILDPAPAPNPDEVESILYQVYILTPNDSEGEILAKVVGKGTSAEERAALLLDCGAENLVLKLGEAGCMHATASKGGESPNEFVRVAPLRLSPEEVVDSTAAGDAFTGGLGVALARGDDMSEACRFANVAGAVACTRKGTLDSMPYLFEVEKFLSEKKAKEKIE